MSLLPRGDGICNRSSQSRKKTVLFEEKFSKMDLKMFDTLEEVQQWMEIFNKNLGL